MRDEFRRFRRSTRWEGYFHDSEIHILGAWFGLLAGGLREHPAARRAFRDDANQSSGLHPARAVRGHLRREAARERTCGERRSPRYEPPPKFGRPAEASGTPE